MTAPLPVLSQRRRETQACRRIVGCHGRRECTANVVQLHLESIEPVGTAHSQEQWFGLVGKGEEHPDVAATDIGVLAGIGQALDGILADRFKHREPRLGPFGSPEEAVVDERCEPVQYIRVEPLRADLLGHVERASTGERAEPREETAFGFVQEIVAPSDGRSQRSVSLREIARDAARSGSRSRSRIAAGDRVFARPAASSIARGRPSR